MLSEMEEDHSHGLDFGGCEPRESLLEPVALRRQDELGLRPRSCATRVNEATKARG